MEEYRKTMLIGAAELSDTTLISGNVDEGYLGYTIATAQSVYLEELIGTALYRRLQEIVYETITKKEGGGLDHNPNYAELLEEYVKPFLRARCTVDILFNIHFKMKNAGIVMTPDTQVNTVSLKELQEMTKQYMTYVDTYADRMSKYLCANRDKFPELQATTEPFFLKPQTGKDYANDGGLWLGSYDEKNNCGCR